MMFNYFHVLKSLPQLFIDAWAKKTFDIELHYCITIKNLNHIYNHSKFKVFLKFSYQIEYMNPIR